MVPFDIVIAVQLQTKQVKLIYIDHAGAMTDTRATFYYRNRKLLYLAIDDLVKGPIYPMCVIDSSLWAGPWRMKGAGP